MLALIVLLHLLLTALFRISWTLFRTFWLLVAVLDRCLQASSSLFVTAILALFKIQPPIANPPHPPTIHFQPSFPLHIILHHLLRRQLPSSSPLLRGSRFAALADNLIVSSPSHISQNFLDMGLEPPSEKEISRMEYLKTLPELRVTPSEEGNRKPERGEKGGGRVRVLEGMLQVPVRKSTRERESDKVRRMWRPLGVM